MKTNAVLSVTLCGILALASGCGVAPDGDVDTTTSALTTTTATLINGWVGAPFSTGLPGWTCTSTSGIVYLRGGMSGGVAPLAFTLPSGCRPNARLYVPVNLFQGLKGRLIIETSGTVSVYDEGGAASTNAFKFTSLDGVSFPVTGAGGTVLTLKNGWSNTVSLYGTRAPTATLVGGVVHLAGSMKTSGPSLNAFRLPAGMAPSTEIYLTVDLCGGRKGDIRLDPAGEAITRAQTSISDAYCFTSLESVSFPLTPATPSGYTCLSLSGGWVLPSNTRFPCMKNDGGVVRLLGAMRNGTTNPPITLPAGMRPSRRVYIEADMGSAQQGRLIIEPSGTVTLDTSTFSTAQSFTSLEGVLFPL